MKRFSLYLVREIIPLYVAGLVAFVLLLLSVSLLQVLADIIARGASPALVSKFLLYSLPEAVGFGIPLALLFAALLALTRLAQDSEIKAALLLGLSPRQFAQPLLLIGLLISLLSFANNELLVPWSKARALEVQKDILLQSPEVLVSEGRFFTDALGRSIFIESLEPGGVVGGVTVIQSGDAQGPKEVYRAESGRIDEDAGLWELFEVRFSSYRNNRLVLDARAERLELPVRRLAAGFTGDPDLTKISLRDLLSRLRRSSRQYASAEWTALHRKFAEPLAATAFALFALAVGLYSFRSGLGLGLVSVLFLTFLYYATWSVAKLLGAQGTLPAWVAGWLPVALYAAAAAVLLAVTWRR